MNRLKQPRSRSYHMPCHQHLFGSSGCPLGEKQHPLHPECALRPTPSRQLWPLGEQQHPRGFSPAQSQPLVAGHHPQRLAAASFFCFAFTLSAAAPLPGSLHLHLHHLWHRRQQTGAASARGKGVPSSNYAPSTSTTVTCELVEKHSFG
jgi:hypothetical protein